MADNTVQIATTDSWVARNKWLLLLIAVGLIVLGAYVVKTRFYTLSEEPPIRVKNGSMEIILLRGQWVPNKSSNPTAWVPMDDDQTKGLYDVKVAQGPGVTCESGWNGMSGDVNKIVVTYNDKFKVTFMPDNAAGKSKTHVTPHNGLVLAVGLGQVLRHDVIGFIETVTVHEKGGGQLKCGFDATAQADIAICPPGHAACGVQ